MEISEFCGTCIYDRQKCKQTPITQTTGEGRLYCPGKRSKYESWLKETDTCDICGQKFTDEEYMSLENVVYEIRHPIVYDRIEDLRVFCFDVHKRCMTKENQKMLIERVWSILDESKLTHGG